MAVSRSSTEADIIAVEAGLRMEGLPVGGVSQTIIDVFQPQAAGDFMRQRQSSNKRALKSKSKSKENFDNVDSVPASAHIFSQRAFLYVLDDKEAVIKIVIKAEAPIWDTFPELTESI